MNDLEFPVHQNRGLTCPLAHPHQWYNMHTLSYGACTHLALVQGVQLVHLQLQRMYTLAATGP